MRALLRYTLDLFEPFAPDSQAQAAPEIIATASPSQPHPQPRIEVTDEAPTAVTTPVSSLREAILPANFAHPQANRTVHLSDARVAYLFERARRRTIGFMVSPEGLVVRAPRWTPLYEVDAALQAKAAWITRKLEETRERQARRDEACIDWRDGACFPYLGSSIVVVLDPEHTFAEAGAQLEPLERRLYVALPHSANPQQLRDSVQAWLMRQAQAHFKQRLEHFAPLLQVQWKSLRLSHANTRWGSAKADGSIRLNWRLMHYSPAVIDYVVAHELSHLRVMDHSPRFWQTVESVLPDYAQVRQQLKDDGMPRW